MQDSYLAMCIKAIFDSKTKKSSNNATFLFSSLDHDSLSASFRITFDVIAAS